MGAPAVRRMQHLLHKEDHQVQKQPRSPGRGRVGRKVVWELDCHRSPHIM